MRVVGTFALLDKARRWCTILEYNTQHRTMGFAYALQRQADDDGALSFAAITKAVEHHGLKLEDWMRDAQLRCLRYDGCQELLHWLGY